MIAVTRSFSGRHSALNSTSRSQFSSRVVTASRRAASSTGLKSAFPASASPLSVMNSSVRTSSKSTFIFYGSPPVRSCQVYRCWASHFPARTVKSASVPIPEMYPSDACLCIYLGSDSEPWRISVIRISRGCMSQNWKRTIVRINQWLRGLWGL